ncbi:MAG: glycosyltransferase family 2 protein [Planctomycetes bacterium]|nr:glycosyltransferase family 2 protein [Planctomycetota bacterium]
MTRVSKKDLSVVVPLYNEEESIWPLAKAIMKVMLQLGRPYEVIFVDDGSTDQTIEHLKEIAQAFENVVILKFSKNFGQTAAMAAGFHHARGRYIVSMDGDLQNDPEDIPKILHYMDNGYDIVSGWRKDRKDFFATRRLPSIVANRILSWVTNVRIHDFGCTLKGYRADFVRNIRLYSDMHRYIPGMATAVGARVKEIVVRHHPRRFGKSKYGISRAIKVMSDMIVLRMLIRFSAQPLHYFALFSIPIFLFALVMSFVAFVDTTRVLFLSYTTIVLPTIAVLGFFLAFHFLMSGLLCELVVKVSEESIEQLYTVQTLSEGEA